MLLGNGLWVVAHLETDPTRKVIEVNQARQVKSRMEELLLFLRGWMRFL